MAYERAVRGFLRLSPLLKTLSAKNKVQSKDNPVQDRQLLGHLVTMLLTARSRQYDNILHDNNIIVNPNPSWSAIKFSDTPTEIECARHLAERGVTPDELADAYQYATVWLQESQASEGNTQRRITISRVFEDRIPDQSLWPDEMSYHYDSTLARWRPTLPPVGTTQVIPGPTSGSSTASTPHSLTLTGTSGPSTQSLITVPPVMTVTGPTSNLPDDNVEMGETSAPPIDQMDEDTADGADGPPGPS